MQGCNTVWTHVNGAAPTSHTTKHFLQENIITMVQDDLANNFMNPHPGKLYNKPGGPNVYKDVKLVSNALLSARPLLILSLHVCSLMARLSTLFLNVQDYTGPAVTAKTFLQVLAGKRVCSLFLKVLFMLESCCTAHMFHTRLAA